MVAAPFPGRSRWICAAQAAGVRTPDREDPGWGDLGHDEPEYECEGEWDPAKND